jgi:hypothetical protein
MSDSFLTGFWHSKYKYHSDSRNADFEDEHTVKVYQKGDQVVLESVPGSISYLVIRLSIDGDIATGSWQEHTSKDGYYKGALYNGALQLVISKDKEHMAGKWIGVGNDVKINDGPWEFTYIGKDQKGSK